MDTMTGDKTELYRDIIVRDQNGNTLFRAEAEGVDYGRPVFGIVASVTDAGNIMVTVEYADTDT